MSSEPDFEYVNEKVSKDGQDYEINLLSPDDFEIIRPRCDIPSPLQCSLEEGVRPIGPSLSESGNGMKSRQGVDDTEATHPHSGIEKHGDIETENFGTKFSSSSGGAQLEATKVLRPVPGYSFAIRRKESTLDSSSNCQESLAISYTETSSSPCHVPGTVCNSFNYKEANEPPKDAEICGSVKNITRHDIPSARSTCDITQSSLPQNTLVIVTPPGFKVGADSLPAVKSVVGSHKTVFCSSRNCKDSARSDRGTVISPSLRGNSTIDLPGFPFRKNDGVCPPSGHNGTKIVLLDSKCEGTVSSDLVGGEDNGETEKLSTTLENKLSRSDFNKDNESSQEGLMWKSGNVLTQSGLQTHDETQAKSDVEEHSFETRNISCLSHDGTYGVNVVVDDTSENVSQFQIGNCSQHSVAILEGYDQPLAVSGGLINNTTVSEQTFLQIANMNSDGDTTSGERMSGEVVITQHVLSLPQLYSCQWEGCNTHLLTIDDLISHAVNAHVKPGKDQQYCCQWQGCQRDGRTFNARYKMLIHLRTHTGEKPHVCPVEGCGKSFSRMENLKIHMRCHTGERPYKCPYEGCGKSYSNSSDRFKHTKTHYEKKPYRCKFEGCQKSYTDPSSLRKHHKSHRTKVALSLFVQSGSTTV